MTPMSSETAKNWSGVSRPRARVPPPHEGFRSDDGVQTGMDDRLIVNLEFAIGEGISQLGLEFESLDRPLLHGTLMHRHPVSSRRLRIAQRSVGLTKDEVCCRGRRNANDADTRRDRHPSLAEPERLVDSSQQILGPPLCLNQVAALEERNELISAESRCDVS